MRLKGVFLQDFIPLFDGILFSFIVEMFKPLFMFLLQF